MCAIAFAAFWNRENMAGMVLVLASFVVLGLGFGRMMNSPCPVSAPPPDTDAVPLPPDSPPQLDPPGAAWPDARIEAPEESPALLGGLAEP